MTTPTDDALTAAKERWILAHKALFDTPLVRQTQTYTYKQDEFNYASTELIAQQAERIRELEAALSREREARAAAEGDLNNSHVLNEAFRLVFYDISAKFPYTKSYIDDMVERAKAIAKTLADSPSVNAASSA